jgi:hypothetical protein
MEVMAVFLRKGTTALATLDLDCGVVKIPAAPLYAAPKPDRVNE